MFGRRNTFSIKTNINYFFILMKGFIFNNDRIILLSITNNNKKLKLLECKKFQEVVHEFNINKITQIKIMHHKIRLF